MGQAPVHTYIDELLERVKARELRLDDVISHTLPLSEVGRAYEIFNDKVDNCVKVVLKP
jgi:alcohol dehydrogenase